MHVYRVKCLFVQIVFVILFILSVSLCARAQECGTESPAGKQVPWQVGIYSPGPYYDWKFGGSLISRKVVVTAGHFLFAYMSPQREVRPSTIIVAVGKLSRPWKEPADENTQISDVKELHLAPGFRQLGSGAIPYFMDDIAVVITVNAFKYNDFIRPVCIDFDYDFEEKQLQTDNAGKAAGWGNPAQESPPQHIKTLQYVGVETCAADKATNSFYVASKLFTLAISDKICVEAKTNDSAVCNGDSGIGLAFSAKVNGIQKYYLRGVHSGPLDATKTCSIDTYYGFTSLRKHESFIRKYWNESLEEVPKQIGKCVLPQYPEHGTYATNVTRIANASGGEEFVLVALIVNCDRGYGVMGSNSVNCYNGFWAETMPTCVRTCELQPHPSVEYRCVVSGEVVGSRACANYEPSGTIVSPLCKQHYYSTNIAFMRCKENGQWDQITRCSPDCGRVTPDGKGLVVGGTAVKRGELPWHAGIYTKTTNPYMQICGGSIISKTLILSAAHCFWSDVRKNLPASEFAVAVGKLHRPWNDAVDEAQKSDVNEIHIPTRYQGAGASFQDDIAMVIVTKPFVYMTFVRPVCLSFDSNFDRLQLQTINKGKVAGWGLTASNGKASPVLRVVELPYVEVGTCISDSPKDFGEYITSDKICAGTKEPNSALCKGDSGGGLAFPATDRGVERHYLRGVVSTAPRNNDACNTNTYTSFTQILKHEDFIKPFLSE